MSIIDELLSFGDLPRWVSSSLSLVIKDFGDVTYDFYLEYLTLDQKNPENNNGSAVFLTSEEIIKAYFTLDLITIEKRKLSKTIKVLKRVYTSTEDIFRDQDIKYTSVDLKFIGNEDISLVCPVVTSNYNLEKYQNLISKL